MVSVRSHNSIINEAEKITWDPDFKGYIHDVGGPTANFRAPACKKQLDKVCSHFMNIKGVDEIERVSG